MGANNDGKQCRWNSGVKSIGGQVRPGGGRGFFGSDPLSKGTLYYGPGPSVIIDINYAFLKKIQ